MVIVGVGEQPLEASRARARLIIAWLAHGGGRGYGREHTDTRRASLPPHTHRTSRRRAPLHHSERRGIANEQGSVRGAAGPGD